MPYVDCSMFSCLCIVSPYQTTSCFSAPFLQVVRTWKIEKSEGLSQIIHPLSHESNVVHISMQLCFDLFPIFWVKSSHSKGLSGCYDMLRSHASLLCLRLSNSVPVHLKKSTTQLFKWLWLKIRIPITHRNDHV